MEATRLNTDISRMANEEHLAILQQGIRFWNDWRNKNPGVIPDLSNTDLSRVNLCFVDFRRANCRKIQLAETNLTHAWLSETNFIGANLFKANLTNAQLEYAELSEANLRKANLSKAILARADLREADLTDADLTEAILSAAYLVRTNFTRANLKDAYLVKALLSGAVLIEAKLTGSCLEDWNINSDTKLDNIECHFFYGKFRSTGDNSVEKTERRPSDPSRNFEPDEFTKLFQKALNTVDLIFLNGVDWQALLISLEKLRVEAAGAELSIQAIENKNDGTFVVRVNTPPEADKAEVEKFLKREYEVALKMLEAKYESRLQLQGEQLVFYREELNAKRQENTRLMGVIEIMAENQAPKYDMRGSNFGNFIDTAQAGSQQSNIQFITTSQDLSQAAQQIQALLNQLQKNGVSVEVAQEQAATDLAKQAKADPTFKGKLVKWSEAMVNKASETTVSEAVKAVVSLAMKMLVGI